MKAEIKIPKGWKQVADRWKAGDRYFRNDMMAWVEIEKQFLAHTIHGGTLAIRPRAPKKARKA
jgi:hypothetical protein